MAQRQSQAEQGQEQLVEQYLRDHPWSTIPQIRDGIAAETGIRIERVQARIVKISKRCEILKGTGDYGRTSYALGAARRQVKAGGIELSLVVTEGSGVELVARQHGSDIDCPELRALLGGILDAARAALEARAVPLAEAAARAEGLLQESEDESDEDDWLATLTAYQQTSGGGR